jgi:hypothetical protein
MMDSDWMGTYEALTVVEIDGEEQNQEEGVLLALCLTSDDATCQVVPHAVDHHRGNFHCNHHPVHAAAVVGPT